MFRATGKWRQAKARAADKNYRDAVRSDYSQRLTAHMRTSLIMEISLKILVVDDDSVTGTAIAGMLRGSGYNVKSAESGETALGLMALESFDLIITDLRMPGIGGLGLIREIEAQTMLPSSRILVITGEISGGPGWRDLTGLGIPILQKPIRKSELLAAVQTKIGQ